MLLHWIWLAVLFYLWTDKKEALSRLSSYVKPEDQTGKTAELFTFLSISCHYFDNHILKSCQQDCFSCIWKIVRDMDDSGAIKEVITHWAEQCWGIYGCLCTAWLPFNFIWDWRSTSEPPWIPCQGRGPLNTVSPFRFLKDLPTTDTMDITMHLKQ